MKNLEVSTSEQPRPWTPEPFMLRAVRWLLAHGGAGLFLDPGLGKTSINLAALKILKAEGELQNGALVVCELRPLYMVWDARNPDSEPRKWTDFHELTFEMLHGDDKAAALRRKADIYLINPEGLMWLFGKTKIKNGRPVIIPGAIKKKRFDVLVIDESTKFKHANTERFATLRAWLGTFRRRWINTGTPTPNGLLDLFGQIFILDMGNAIGAYITHYRRRFFQPTGYGGYTWVLQGLGSNGEETKESKETEKRIYRAIEPLVMRMDEKDYLKLPPIHGSLAHGNRVPGLIKVPLPPKALERIRELEELFFTELDEGSITAANAGTKHMKLRQAANGGIYLDRLTEDDWKGKRKWAHLHDAKTEAVVDYMDELGDWSCVIAVEFHHDVERLRMNKSLRNVLAIGEGKLSDDVLIARDWNAGRIKKLLVNPASFSRGANMQRGGDALIFHSLIWNLEHYDQLIRRFYRRGRKRPFYVKHVVAEGTSDGSMIKRLGMKDRSQRAMLAALREYSLKRPHRGG